MKKNIFYFICAYFSFQQNIVWATENTLTTDTLELPAVAVGSDFYHAKLKLIDKVPPAKFLVTDLKQLNVETNFPPTSLWNARDSVAINNLVFYKKNVTDTAVINDTVYFQKDSNSSFDPFFSYNLLTDQWNELPPIPIADPLTQEVRGMTGYNNAIYARIEHINNEDILFHKYDVSTQKWQQNIVTPAAIREATIFPEFNNGALHNKYAVDNNFYAISYGLDSFSSSFPALKTTPIPAFLHVFDQSEGEWKGRATLPRVHASTTHGATAPIVVVARNTLYSFSFNGFHFLLQQYKPTSDSWITTVERELFPDNLSSYDNESFIVTIPKLEIGGSDKESNKFLTQFKLINNQNRLVLSLIGFDPLIDSKNPLLLERPEAMSGHSSLVLNNEIYFFHAPNPDLNSIDLDSGMGAGKFHNNKLSQKSVKTYNPLIQTWSHKDNISFNSLEGVFQILHHKNKLYQVNNEPWSNKARSMTLSTTNLITGEKRNTASNTAGTESFQGLRYWENNGTTGAILNDKLYLFGGAIIGPYFPFGPQLIPAMRIYGFNSRIAVYDIVEDRWDMESVPNLPTPRWYLSSAVVQNKIYTFGGNLGSISRQTDSRTLRLAATDTVEIYDPNNNSWFIGTSMPTPRTAHANVAVENDIYIFGGEDFDHEFLQRVDVYDTVNNSWKKARAMPFALKEFSADFVNNKIYIYGGIAKTQHKSSMPSRSFMIYDPTTDTWETEPPEIAYLTRSGLQHIKYNGETAGTTEQGRPLNQLRIQLFNLECSVRYQVYGSNGTGWSDWFIDGQTVNFNSTPTTFIEAVKIELVNCPGWQVEYQAHIQNVSWTNWATNGAVLGQPEHALRLEALKIRLVQE